MDIREQLFSKPLPSNKQAHFLMRFHTNKNFP